MRCATRPAYWSAPHGALGISPGADGITLHGPGGCAGRALAVHRVRLARVDCVRLLTWRHPGQLPQVGDEARATGLWRVRGESFASELVRG